MKTRTAQLSEVARIGAGQGAPQDRAAFTKEGHPFIRAASLEVLCSDGSHFTLERIDESAAAKHRLRLYSPNTVVFAKSGMSATKNRIYQLRKPAYVVNHLATVEPSEELDATYLRYWLESFNPTRLIQDTAYPSISQEDISAVHIPLPDISEQQRIAKQLREADRLRRTRRYGLELSDTFPKSGFASLFGSAAEAMKRFPVFELGELTNFIDYRGISPNKQPSGVRLVTARNVKRGHFEIEPQEFIPVQEYESWMRRGMPRPGDVLFTTEGHTLGSAAKLPAFEKTALAQRLIALQPGQRIISNYLLHFVLTPLFQDEVVKRSTGSAARGITSKQLAEIRIPAPPLSMQAEFSSLVVRAERLRALQRESLRQAEHLFHTLLHRAFAEQL